MIHHRQVILVKKLRSAAHNAVTASLTIVQAIGRLLAPLRPLVVNHVNNDFRRSSQLIRSDIIIILMPAVNAVANAITNSRARGLLGHVILAIVIHMGCHSNNTINIRILKLAHRANINSLSSLGASRLFYYFTPILITALARPLMIISFNVHHMISTSIGMFLWSKAIKPSNALLRTSLLLFNNQRSNRMSTDLSDLIQLTKANNLTLINRVISVSNRHACNYCH